LTPASRLTGTATISFPDRAELADLALGPGGELVAVGKIGDSLGSDLAAGRLLPDGSPDSSFSGDGAATVEAGYNEFATSVAVSTDGRIVIGGVNNQTSGIGPASPPTPLLFRLDPNGGLDESFPVLSEGLASAGAGKSRPIRTVADVAVQPDGILGVGEDFSDSPVSDFVLFRRHADGAPDRSFLSANGSVRTNIAGGRDRAMVIAEQADGRILVAGTAWTESDGELLGIARYLGHPGRRDQDADGIRDRRDRCPRGFSKRRRGCPILRDFRSISIGVDGRAIEGSLDSRYLECMNRKRVVIRRRRPGTDPLVASSKARYTEEIGHGKFFVDDLRAGVYYARAPRRVTGVGICHAVTSTRERVPR
jgi:uncharacterized delta-60 repeat protein